MTARLIFELPLPENLGNSRMHWAVKHRAKRDYWARLDTLVMLKRLPRAPQRPWPEASAAVEMRTYRDADRDNATARLKWVFDWLQSRGYIANDRDLSSCLHLTTAPLAACGITLTLEPTPRAAA